LRSTKKEEFLEKARSVHGGRYGYSNVTKSSYRDIVSIYCDVHGEFSQRVACHLRGRGCPSCGLKSRSDKRRLDTKSFCDRAMVIHDGFYFYDSVVYENMFTPVKIICREHGSFMQSPSSHFNGSGCPTCGTKKARDHHQHTLDDFISRAKNVHGEKYEYGKAIYIESKEKLCITCPSHGDFFQIAAYHLSGNGCPSCSRTGFNPGKNGYLYLLKSSDGSLLKIGVSHNLRQRFSRLTAKTPFSFTIEFTSFMSGQDAARLEKEILGRFMSAGFTGFDGATEWLRYDDEIMKYFKDHELSVLTH